MTSPWTLAWMFLVVAGFQVFAALWMWRPWQR
jgi:HAMP domain-containing protein